MKIYAVINQKGGIGKTTTCATLGAGFTKAGKKVLVIDMDAQCNLSYVMQADHSSPTIYEVLTGNAELKSAIVSSVWGFDIVPSSPAMAVLDNAITTTGKEYRLKEAIQSLKTKYDFIIIDTPPALSLATTNALAASDSLIIPAQAEAFSMQGIGRLYETITTVKKYCNANLYIEGILFTQYDNRTLLSRAEAELAEQTAEAMGTKVFNVKIRNCSGIKEAFACKQDIFNYKPSKKVANAVADYTALIKELQPRIKL